MADNSTIEWTDATWQIVTGCSVLSPGCTNCYAMRLAGGRLQHHPSRRGLTTKTKAGPVWNGMVRFNVQWLRQPLQWRKPRDIFVAAHGDLFHEVVQNWMLVKVFAVMAMATWHRFQVLTKRADRMAEFCLWLETPEGRSALQAAMLELGATFVAVELPLSNVWLGVSVEDQPRAQERIPYLQSTPAAVRWISAEPLLGLVRLDRMIRETEHGAYVDNCLTGFRSSGMGGSNIARIDWVVAGGESGPAARPSYPDWFRSLRDQCAEAKVPFFFKQWGAWAPGECAAFAAIRTERVAWLDEEHPARWTFSELTPRQSEETHRDDEPDVYRIGKKRSGAKLDGVEHREMPT